MFAVQTRTTDQQSSEKNPIHIDSKWFKAVIGLTGSMESAMVLADTIIYYNNRYRSFKIGSKKLYGLIYSAREYQKNLNISYRKAMSLPKNLVKRGFLEAHDKKFICNRTFYTPTKKALESVYKIHFAISHNCSKKGDRQSLSNEKTTNPFKKIDIEKSTLPSGSHKKNLESVVHICKSGCANMHKPYKDKEKDKNNNIENNHYYKEKKNDRVFFKFKKIKKTLQCEEKIFHSLTKRQIEVINNIIYNYEDKIDTKKFTRIIYRSKLKQKVKDFRQFVIRAYLLTEKKNKKKEEKAKSLNSSYLLTESNILYLIEIFSLKGINSASLILKTARNVANEYLNLSFDGLLSILNRLLIKSSKNKKSIKILNVTIPKVDIYTLKKDWASKAAQNFYADKLPCSQKIALASIIHYVKSKGIIISSEQEVYEWLYYMAINQDYYYNKARSFKHWCNIIIKQFIQKRLNKPKGFDLWLNQIQHVETGAAA